MKTKLEMAHEYAIALLRSDSENMEFDKFIQLCWNYADTMQAEADKREKEEAAQRRKEIREMLNAPNTFVEREGQHFDDVANQKRTPKVSRFERSDAVKEVLNMAENMGLIKPKEPRETHKNLAEFKMHPEYDASINYPPDAWVMYKGEKILAVSIDIKKEWQPDWSQAPEWANFLVMSFKGTAYWHSSEPRPSGAGWVDGGHCDLAHLDCYCTVGDWRESLRKRPQ